MRILHLGKYYPSCPGGMESFLGDLLPALQKENLQVAALVHAHDQPERRSHPFPLWRVPTYGRVLYAPFSPAFPFWLKEMIGKWRPDLIHIHLPNLSAFWLLALPEARRIPWLIHWHADVVPSRIDSRLAWAYRGYRPLEQALLRRSSVIVATSPPYRNGSPALAPWLDKTKVVPLGVDPHRLPLPSATDLEWARGQWRPQTGLRLLCIGRLTYYKGHKVLFEALSSLAGIELLCVGGGELHAELETLIHRLHLDDRVRLLDQLPDSRRNGLLLACDALVLPSLERTEAFGLVLLEAMRYQKPVIATRIEGSGTAWVVQEGKTGWLVPPADPNALAECLKTASKSPEARVRLGQAGAKRFQAYFHIQKCAQRLREIYRQVPYQSGAKLANARSN